MPERQKTFDDFEQEEREEILRLAHFPPVPHVGANGLRRILKKIDRLSRNTGECYASAAWLADELTMHLRTVQRAIAALDSLGLVASDRRRTNHLRVVWPALKALVPRVETYGPRPQESYGLGPQDEAKNTNETYGLGPHDLTAHGQRLTALGRIKEKEIKDSPPPTSSAPDPWEEVEEVFARFGIAASADLVTAAKERRLSPAEAIAIAKHFGDHQAANDWQPGALFSRIRNAIPNEDPATRWPPAPAKLAQRREARVEVESADPDPERERRIAERRQELERDFGQELDGKTRDEQRELLRRATASLPLLEQESLMREWLKHKMQGRQRDRALAYLAKNAHAGSSL